MVSPIEGFDGVQTCTFAMGANCEFQLATPAEQLINFSGVLGQNLGMGLCAECLGSSYPNFGVVNYEGTVTDPLVTPEPGTGELVLAAIFGLGLGYFFTRMVLRLCKR